MFDAILEIFDSTIIIDKTYVVFKYYMYLIPVFFGVSLGFRMLEEGLKNIGEEANYSKAFQEAFTASILVFSYTAVACLACQFVLSIKNYAGSQGAFTMIFGEYNEIITKMKEVAIQQEGDWLDDIINKVGFPVELFAGACFSLTFAILMFIHLFLRFAYAIIFCFLFTWGGIAIATSPSESFSMKGGFIATLKGLIIWPIIESFFYSLAYLLISQGGDKLVKLTTNATQTGDMAFTYFIFSFANIFLIAVVVAAAAVAFYLSQNQSAMAGITAPFIAAGMGAGAMVSRIMKRGGQRVWSPGQKNMNSVGVGSSFKNVGVGTAAGLGLGLKKAGVGIGNIITNQAAKALSTMGGGEKDSSKAKEGGGLGNIINSSNKEQYYKQFK